VVERRGENGEAGIPLPIGERVAAQRRGEGAIAVKRRFAPKPASFTKPLARSMRAQPTDAESVLWFELRNRLLNGYRFSRQVRIGPYIADLVCRSKKLIVELDGRQHCDDASDERRTRYLNAAGYSVLRFWNNEVFFERQAVLETILATLEGRISTRSPGLRFAPAGLSPVGRGIPRAPE
jgi:very-short-patch-repair endonuclease